MKNFIEFLYSKFLQSDGVSIDTRTLEKDDLFFAIKGPNFNGNQYAKQALEKGASFAVVDEEKYANDPRAILAPDGLKALQDLASFHRSRFKKPVLALTGSNGKTTTKELINRVLQKKYITHATEGNLNNHLGVPLTLLHLLPQTEIVVIEMGANHVGEIAALCKIANPDHGLITNIGEAHTELFGGIEGVLRGKSELFDHLRSHQGKVFVNMDDFRLANMAKRFEDPVLFPADDLQVVSSDPYLQIELGGRKVATNLIGKYNFGNIAAAVAVGRHFGVKDEDILEAVQAYVPSNQRSQVIERGSIRIIDDCYNANPTSMRAALENLSQLPGKRIAILGDMKEVEEAEKKHREIGNLVNELGIDQALFVGEAMKFAHGEVNGSSWYPDVEKLIDSLKDHDFEQSSILIKASKSVNLRILAKEMTK